jgi:hypothetical protein
MVELAERHLCTNILAHGHKSNPENCKCLERVVLLGFRLFITFLLWIRNSFFGIFGIEVFAALLQHCLHTENIASPRERTHLNKNLNLL